MVSHRPSPSRRLRDHRRHEVGGRANGHCRYYCNTAVITVNERGALTLPREVRDKLGVTRGGHLVVDMDEHGEVILRAGVVMPVEVYAPARVKEFQRMNEAPLADKRLTWRKNR